MLFRFEIPFVETFLLPIIKFIFNKVLIRLWVGKYEWFRNTAVYIYYNYRLCKEESSVTAKSKSSKVFKNLKEYKKKLGKQGLKSSKEL